MNKSGKVEVALMKHVLKAAEVYSGVPAGEHARVPMNTGGESEDCLFLQAV